MSNQGDILVSLMQALDKTGETRDHATKALQLVSSTNEHNYGMALINQNAIKKLAIEYSIPEDKIRKVKKEAFYDLPDIVINKINKTSNGMKEILGENME